MLSPLVQVVPFPTLTNQFGGWAYGNVQRRVAQAPTMPTSSPHPSGFPRRINEEGVMSLGMILLILLVLALVGVIPAWGHSSSWGYGPSGGIGLVLLIVLILLLMGKI